VSICIRNFEDNKIQERFLGFVRTNSTTSTSLYELLISNLRYHNLDVQKYLVGQCFDGAATMSGCKNGLQTQVNNLINFFFHYPIVFPLF
jgi:hypothetical protein